MTKWTAAFFIIVIPIFLLSQEDTNVHFPDSSRAMKAYGFSAGTLNTHAEIITKLKKEVSEKVGTFELTKAIDSDEEFLTAAFYSDISVEDENSKSVLTEELSVGRNGGILLGALWLKKSVDTGSSYEEALSYIEKKSDITRDRMESYYRAAISSEIDRVTVLALKDIPKRYYDYVINENDGKEGEKTNGIDLIKEYYMYPTQDNYKRLLQAVYHFGQKGLSSKRDLVRFKAFISVIDTLSSGLKKRITDDMDKI